MTNSTDPDLDLHGLLRQGMSCSAREGLNISKMKRLTISKMVSLIILLFNSNTVNVHHLASLFIPVKQVLLLNDWYCTTYLFCENEISLMWDLGYGHTCAFAFFCPISTQKLDAMLVLYSVCHGYGPSLSAYARIHVLHGEVHLIQTETTMILFNNRKVVEIRRRLIL